MSIQKVISRSLVSAFVLSIAGLAAARQPPALVRAQAATAYSVACEGNRAESGAGYRDAATRSHTASSNLGIAKAGAGYRDIYARSRVVAAPDTQFACVSPQLTASR